MIVVKCSGSDIDRAAICTDLAQLRAAGRLVLLVHGGGAEADGLLRGLGREPEYYTSPSGVTSRRCTPRAVEAITMALTGKVKPDFLRHLAAAGARPVGLTGLDGQLLRARRKSFTRALVDGRTVSLRNEYAGRITRVDAGAILALVAAGFVPVISPPAFDPDGAVVNVNADRVAAAIAVALRARTLVFLSAVPGVLDDHPDPATLVRELAVRPGAVPLPHSGGMTAKLLASREALEGGVGVVRIASGTGHDPVTAALRGGGTRVVLQRQAAPVPAGRAG